MTSTREDSPVGGLTGTPDLSALDRKLRLLCWSDRDLAEAAGLSKRTISNLRKDPSGASERTWKRIAQAIVAKEREDPEFVRTMGELRGTDGGG